MSPITVPTPNVVSLLCVVQHVVDGVGDLCRCLCHTLDRHLIFNEVERLLEVRPCILDEEQLLHFLGHGGQKFEVVLLAFSHRG